MRAGGRGWRGIVRALWALRDERSASRSSGRVDACRNASVTVRGLAWKSLRRAWIACAPVSFARHALPDDAELGLLGERLAEDYLRRAGWTVLARRCQTAGVEVDLVAREGGRTVLVEVKSGRVGSVPVQTGHVRREARRDRGPLDRYELRWRPGLRCSHARLERLRAVARALDVRAGSHPVHRELPGPGARTRIDLIEVLLGAGGSIHFVHHRGLARPLGRA